jgi:uncharacterized phage protein (TIGR02218 family)
MPRTIPAGLASHIAGGATSLCELIRITPVVGGVLAFTNHIQPLTVEGQLYVSRPGMRVSLVKSNVRMEIDTSEGAGFFATGIISLADVLRGKFVDAIFERRFCNYDSPGDGACTFQSGYVGRVTVQDNVFNAELRSLMAAISQPVGRIISRRCDVRRLGDSRCKFDMTSTQAATGSAPFRQTLSVAAVVSQIQIRVDSGFNLGDNGGGVDDWFRSGIIHWNTGANAGYESEIAWGDQEGITPPVPLYLGLLNAPGQDIAIGDTFYAEAGCDRSTGHCQLKFKNASQPNGNLLNFRGFPYLIGDDLYQPGDALAFRPVPGEGG